MTAKRHRLSFAFCDFMSAKSLRPPTLRVFLKHFPHNGSNWNLRYNLGFPT